MKKLMSVIFLMILSISTIYANTAPAADPITGSTLGVLTPQHPSYQLTLTSNPTTGYIWLLQSYDSHGLVLLSHQYIAPNNRLMGAPGKEVWQFQATHVSFLAPSVSEIHLIYARPWDVAHGNQVMFYLVSK
jgi:inhibitor of cysteine peptidase